jgi:proteasome accessory factor B
MSISRIYRLLRVITLLQGGRGYTANDLATELEVSRRTVFRDLNMLEMAHIPYYFDADNGGYRIGRHFFLPPINLTLTEALAILLLAGRMKSSSKLPLLTQGARAAVKIESAIPRAMQKHIGSIIDKLSVSMAPVARHEGLDSIFDELADAIAAGLVCKLVYISFHEKKQITVTVNPMRLTFKSRAWYLIAYSSAHREVRTFKLSRIRKLTVTEKTFAQPAEPDVADYFGDAWSMIPEGEIHEVHLRFSQQVAGNVAEVQWHNSQRVEWREDGSMDFHVTVDGLGEITWWILGYGDQVEVIAPPELRGRIADVARAALQKNSEPAVK